MRLSRFFIDRPIFAAVLSIVVFIAGLIAMLSLPISEYPEVVPPSIVVRAIYPGANPRVLSEAVATPPSAPTRTASSCWWSARATAWPTARSSSGA